MRGICFTVHLLLLSSAPIKEQIKSNLRKWITYAIMRYSTKNINWFIFNGFTELEGQLQQVCKKNVY